MIHPALLHIPTPNWAAMAWSMPYGWYEPPPPPDLSDLPPPGRYHLDPARSSVRAKVRAKGGVTGAGGRPAPRASPAACGSGADPRRSTSPSRRQACAAATRSATGRCTACSTRSRTRCCASPPPNWRRRTARGSCPATSPCAAGPRPSRCGSARWTSFPTARSPSACAERWSAGRAGSPGGRTGAHAGRGPGTGVVRAAVRRRCPARASEPHRRLSLAACTSEVRGQYRRCRTSSDRPGIRSRPPGLASRSLRAARARSGSAVSTTTCQIRPYASLGRVNVVAWWWALNSSRNESSTTRSPSWSRSGMPCAVEVDRQRARVPGVPVVVGHRVRRRGAARRCRRCCEPVDRAALEEPLPAEHRMRGAQRGQLAR